ncbi:MAG: hypothetical protein GY798_21360 [Hyphomicrobiales bacterium]|nr:hypothetical protein [Hyphomicrobiales bacterium]
MLETRIADGEAKDERNGEFWLFDLKVDTVVVDRTAICRHVEGEGFLVEGEALVSQQNQRVLLCALAAVIDKARRPSGSVFGLEGDRGGGMGES